MPFAPGEDVNLRFVSEHPDRARLDFMGQAYTVENMGLALKRKDALIAVVRVPRYPGKYSYKFTDGSKVETGHLRVVIVARPDTRRTEAAQPQPRYRGPGSGAR